MGASVVRTRLPGDRELEARLAELVLLQEQLADRELELATSESTLHEFNQRYLKTVGPKYAELDRIEAEIAERIAARDPGNKEQAQKATEARRRASDTAAAIGEISRMPVTGPRSETLKRLYREAARKMHPDYGDDSEDRKVRENYMTKVNEAYSRGDEEVLRELLDEWDNSPGSVKGIGLAAELERTIRRIAQLKKRLKEIEARMEELTASELSQLYSKFCQAEKTGKDLLQELAESIDSKIEHAQERLQRLVIEGA